jgi:ubiquinone/menaquinone biosynthesis C-methylase UbiE
MPPSSPDTIAPRYTSHPVFAAFYQALASGGGVRDMLEPLRRETAGQAYGLVLEVGAGTGLNFAHYRPEFVTRVDAVEPDRYMLRRAQRAAEAAPVPVTLTQAPAEELPFAEATFDSAVATMVFCSVADPEQGLREILRVLKPGGELFMFEHVRAAGELSGRVQDALVPVTTRLFGNCHWNRDTAKLVSDVGFAVQSLKRHMGGLHPMIVLNARRPD